MKHAARHTAATITTTYTASAIVIAADATKEKDPADMATCAATILKAIKKKLNNFSKYIIENITKMKLKLR